MSIKRFEDLECWQQARALTRMIYEFTKQKDFSRDFRLSAQICSAAVSVMNNISEGFDSKSSNEFVRFLTYSRRSCSEVQNCLYVAFDQRYVCEEEFRNAYQQCERVRKVVDGLIRHLKKPRANGLTGPRPHGQTHHD